MVTGTTPISGLPTGTIDNWSALIPITIGMPSSPQTIQSPLFQLANGGWLGVPDTWTYASATTINVPAGATSLYQKGWGIRFKQGGAYKYAYIVGVASALLTVTGGSDYSVANSSITDIAYSPNPNGAFGFPGVFNWTATPSRGGTAYTNLPVVNTAVFTVKGRRLDYELQYTQNATPGGTGTVLTSLPVPVSIRSIGNGFNLNSLAQFSGFHEAATSVVSLFPIEATASEIYLLSGMYYI